MPVVAVRIDKLNDLLQKPCEMDTLVDALEQLGCDVEDTSRITLYDCPACGAPNEKSEKEDPPKRCNHCGAESGDHFEKIDSHEVIRIDLLADRPDLFDVGGLARALRGYMGIEEGVRDFEIETDSGIEVKVESALSNIRPYIACAIIKMPPLDHDTLREMMKMQENLHWGIGRDRKLSSIGIYDMSVIKPPIRYTAIEPDGMRFNPLGVPEGNMTPAEVIEKHPKGVTYGHLIKSLAKYPLLIDSAGMVLSLPPIINSEETKCGLGSRHFFIDVTGVSSDAVHNSLNTLVCALTELGGKAEKVKITYPDRSVYTPDLSTREIEVSPEKAEKWLGFKFTEEQFLKYLQKMRLTGAMTDKAQCKVRYPAYRMDILHPVDIFEDIAIARGYQNIETGLVPTMTVGTEREEERISQVVREVMIGLGFTEIMSLVLHSEERLYANFQIEEDQNNIVVGNPKTVDQKAARTHLMTGIMETFHKNRRKSLPQKIFEIGNIITLNPETDTGVKEYRQLAFAITGPEAGYADARAIMDSALRELGVEAQYNPLNHPAFTEGRCAEITLDNKLNGRIGEIAPQVINNFGLAYPTVYAEVGLYKIL